MKIFFAIFFCLFSTNIFADRNKRFVYFPYGGSYKLVIGIGIPVKIAAKHQNLVFASNIQFQYPQVTNLTQIQGGLPPILTRKKRNIENEWMLTYKSIEIIMDKYGINGKTCLLRSICENAMFSLHHDANGLYGELLHIILTPNYGNGTSLNVSEEYLEAQRAGEFGIDCLSMYPGCPLGHSLLDLISVLE